MLFMFLALSVFQEYHTMSSIYYSYFAYHTEYTNNKGMKIILGDKQKFNS